MACTYDATSAIGTSVMHAEGGYSPITLVPNCRSNPSFVVCSIGGIMTPPLLNRTSSRLSLLDQNERPFKMTFDHREFQQHT